MTEGVASLSGTSSNEEEDEEEEEEGEGDATPCNSPKEVRKTPLLQNKTSPLMIMQRQSVVPSVNATRYGIAIVSTFTSYSTIRVFVFSSLRGVLTQSVRFFYKRHYEK